MVKYNILIIEDHALTRFGLKTVFEMEYNDEDLNYVKKVFEASNAQKGFEIIEKENIDVIIMDLGLPDMNGIKATRIIKSKHPSIKIIVLSSHEKEDDVINSIKAGANAYFTKDVDQDKLVYIVSSVLKGAAWFDPKVAGYVLKATMGADSSDNSQAKEFSSETDIKLTTREKQVLKLITEGFSNNEISEKLELSINTIKVHVCKILHKLSVADRTQAAIIAFKHKLI